MLQNFQEKLVRVQQRIILVIAFTIFFLALFTTTSAQSPDQGSEPRIPEGITNFSVERIFQNVQIHSISTDQRGLVYFAFSHGIAEFDGVEWRRISVPDSASMYALAVNDNGRIYGGGEHQIGYLYVDEFGNTKFRSLLHQLEDSFSDTIFDIEIIGQNVFFIGLNSILRYSGRELQLVETGNFVSAGNLQGTLLVSDEEEGIQYLINGQLRQVNSGKAMRPISMQSLADKSLLMATRSDGFFKMDIVGERFHISPWQNEASRRLNQSLVSSIDVLNGRLIAVGSYENGVVIANPDGSVRTHFTERDGILNNSVYHLFFTPGSNLWVGLNEGTALLEMSTLYDDFSKRDTLLSQLEERIPNTPDSTGSEADNRGWLVRLFSKIHSWWSGEAEPDTLAMPSQTQSSDVLFASIIRRVEYMPTDSVIFGGAYSQTVHGVQVLQQSDSTDYSFPYNINAFRFSYAANKYDDLDELEFQVKLVGLDRGWSTWSGNTYREYTNLDWGEYTFLVRARNADGEVSIPSAFSFDIIPPWYEATWFYLLQFAVLLGALSVSAILNKTGRAVSLSEALIAIVVIVIFQYVEFYSEPYLDEYSNNIAVFKIGLSIVFGFSLEYIEEGFHYLIARLIGVEKDEYGESRGKEVNSNQQKAMISSDM